MLDEIPGAYKDIDAVMAAQADLVEVAHAEAGHVHQGLTLSVKILVAPDQNSQRHADPKVVYLAACYFKRAFSRSSEIGALRAFFTTSNHCKGIA